MRSFPLRARVRAPAGVHQADQKGGSPGRKSTFIEKTILGCTIEESPKLVPGVLYAAAIVVLAILLTNWINQAWNYKGVVSYILTAIALGIVVRNTVGLSDVFRPGISFSLNTLLKLGIILMGVRLSLSDVLIIGGWGMPIVIGCILTGLAVTTYFTRMLHLSDRLGTLVAVGSSICGASAIVATAPAIEAKDDEIAYAIANITLFGILAMFTYPYLADFLFGGDLVQVGLFTGTSIHNTAQVAAAALIYDQSFPVSANASATDIAVVTKLVRNGMMVMVVPAMIFIYARRMASSGDSAEPKKLGIMHFIPLFVVGFVMMATLRSIGDANLGSNSLALGIWDGNTWAGLMGGIKTWAEYLLATAMAGVGLGTSFKTMKGLGLKPFAVGLVSAVIVGFTSILMVILVGPLVEF